VLHYERDRADGSGVAGYVGGVLLAFGPRGIGLALSPSNERLELLMKRGDWRQAADRFRFASRAASGRASH
jgi:hypothetical protein